MSKTWIHVFDKLGIFDLQKGESAWQNQALGKNSRHLRKTLTLPPPI